MTAKKASVASPKRRRREKKPEVWPSNLDEAVALLDEKQHSLEKLNFLVEASKILNSTLDLGELLGLILDLSTEHTEADRGSLFLVDGERRELWSLLAHGMEQREIRMPMGKGIAGWVAESGETVNLEDAYQDARFDPTSDQKSGYRTKTLLCAPIKNRVGKIVGVLQLLNRKKGMFTDHDVDFLESISVHAALALENAQLHRESLERQRLERELDLARQIQHSLLPAEVPQIPGYDIAVRYKSSLQVGGDYYDFIHLNEKTFVFVVADVEGKGVASALVMANLQATLHAVLRHVHSLEGVLFNLNKRTLQGTQGRKYLTLFLGLLDLPNRTLHYINAGHVRPMVVRPAGDLISLDEGGVPIGLFPDMRYKRGRVKLETGDVILACSDGIPEAMNTEEEQFEDDRMVAAAREHLTGAPEAIVDAIFHKVDEFTKGSTFLQDDKILMAIKVT